MIGVLDVAQVVVAVVGGLLLLIAGAVVVLIRLAGGCLTGNLLTILTGLGATGVALLLLSLRLAGGV